MEHISWPELLPELLGWMEDPGRLGILGLGLAVDAIVVMLFRRNLARQSGAAVGWLVPIAISVGLGFILPAGIALGMSVPGGLQPVPFWRLRWRAGTWLA